MAAAPPTRAEPTPPATYRTPFITQAPATSRPERRRDPSRLICNLHGHGATSERAVADRAVGVRPPAIRGAACGHPPRLILAGLHRADLHAPRPDDRRPVRDAATATGP